MRKALIAGLLTIVVCLMTPAVAYQAYQGEVGTVMRNIKLNELSGEEVDLNKLLNNGSKYTLLFIWATWCQYCGKEMKDLPVNLAKLEKMGVNVLTISIDDSPKKVIEYMKPFLRSPRTVIDTQENAMRALLMRSVPGNFLITPDRKILMRQIGYGTMDALLQSIAKALQIN